MSFERILTAVAAATASVTLPGPMPVAGEYVQPWIYADGTRLDSLPGWATESAAGYPQLLQIYSGSVAAIGSDGTPYLTGDTTYLRDTGATSHVVRFKIGQFLDGTGNSPSGDAQLRILLGASSRGNAIVFHTGYSSGVLQGVELSVLKAGAQQGIIAATINPEVLTDFGRKLQTGDSIELRIVGRRVHCFANGVRLTEKLGALLPVDYVVGTKVGFGSNNYGWRSDDYYAAPLTAHSVTVTDTLKFWPASSTGRLITYSGTTTGAPTYLQTRILSAVDHSVISPWTTNPTAVFGAGTFSVSVFEPLGDNGTRSRYITQIRPVEDVNGWDHHKAHAVGYGFTNYGQSNSAFRDSSTAGGAITPTGTAYVVANTNQIAAQSSDPWMRGTEPIGLHNQARTLSLALGVPVGVLNFGIGSQPISALVPSGTATFASDWLPGMNTAWQIFQAAAAKCGVTGYSQMLTWTQGEAEADSTEVFNNSSYESYFGELLSGYRSAIAVNPTSPILITVIGSYEEALPGNREAVANDNWSRVRQCLVGLPQIFSGVHVSSSLMRIPHMDAYHYLLDSITGYPEVNRRDAQTAAKLMGISTYDGRGPIITGGSRSGAVITMSVNLNGAASIAGANMTGFDVSSDNFVTLLPINSVNVSGGNVVVTLASAPSGPVKVRSYWGYRPNQSSVITGTYADGTTIQAEPIYNPITVG